MLVVKNCRRLSVSESRRALGDESNNDDRNRHGGKSYQPEAGVFVAAYQPVVVKQKKCEHGHRPFESLIFHFRIISFDFHTFCERSGHNRRLV